MNHRDITSKQITLICTLLSKTDLKDEKKEVVLHYTDNRTYSVGKMYLNEAKELIEFLLKKQPANAFEKDEVANTMRKKIISCLAQYGFVKQEKPDMSKIYEWVRTHGYLKKELNKYNRNELPKLVTQAETMLVKKVNTKKARYE